MTIHKNISYLIGMWVCRVHHDLLFMDPSRVMNKNWQNVAKFPAPASYLKNSNRSLHVAREMVSWMYISCGLCFYLIMCSSTYRLAQQPSRTPADPRNTFIMARVINSQCEEADEARNSRSYSVLALETILSSCVNFEAPIRNVQGTKRCYKN